MTIRPAVPADVEHVLPMVAAVAALHESLDPAKFGYRPDAPSMYRSWLVGRSTDPRSIFLVAEREDSLVAFLVATVESEIPIYRLKEFGFIHDIWVDSAYRNEGIARQLVMLAVERFRQIGVSQVRADVAAANDAGRALLGSCGLRPGTTEMLIELGK